MAARAVVLMTICAAALSACGSDEPKVSSAEYLERCETELARQAQGVFEEGQIASICKCTQDRLVERGDGDKRIDDSSLDDGEQLGRECALDVLDRE